MERRVAPGRERASAGIAKKAFYHSICLAPKSRVFVEHELNRSVAMLRQLYVFQQIRAIITFSNSQSIVGGGEELRLHS